MKAQSFIHEPVVSKIKSEDEILKKVEYQDTNIANELDPRTYGTGPVEYHPKTEVQKVVMELQYELFDFDNSVMEFKCLIDRKENKKLAHIPIQCKDYVECFDRIVENMEKVKVKILEMKKIMKK